MISDPYARTLRVGGDALTGVFGAITRHWKLMVVAVVLSALVALTTTFIAARSTPRFVSEVSVFLQGSKYQVKSADDKLTQVDNLSNLAQAAQVQRADEYRTIVLSPETKKLAAENLAAMTGEPEEPYEATVRIQGAMITLLTAADNPERSRLMANAYGAAVTARLDEIYGQSERDRAQIERELVKARANQEELARQVTALTRADPSDALQRQIAQKEALVKEIAEEQRRNLSQSVAAYYTILPQVDRLQRDATALRVAISDAGRSTASVGAEALLLMDVTNRFVNLGVSAAPSTASGNTSAEGMRVEVNKDGKFSVVSSPSQPAVAAPAPTGSTNLSGLAKIDVESLLSRNLTQADLLADTDALLRAIETRRNELQAAYQRDLRRQLALQSGQTGGAATPALDEADRMTQQLLDALTADIRRLRADLSEAERGKSDLAASLETATTTRKAIEAKVQDANMLTALGSSGKALIVSSAAPGAQSFPPPLSRTLPSALSIALIVGLLVGALASVLSEFLARRRAQGAGPAPLSATAGADD